MTSRFGRDGLDSLDNRDGLDGLTVEQLLADEDDDVAPLGDQLAAIRAHASEGGVTLAVDVHGKVTDLTIDHVAMRLPPHALASKIQALADRAAAQAAEESVAVLAGVTGETLAAELAARPR